MTDPKPPKRIFAEAKVDARAATHVPSSPQTESEAYKLAFQDTDFLLRPDLRPVRFQLELLKPELLMNEANIASTFVFYGSARVPEPAKVGMGPGETADFTFRPIRPGRYVLEVWEMFGPDRVEVPIEVVMRGPGKKG